MMLKQVRCFSAFFLTCAERHLRVFVPGLSVDVTERTDLKCLVALGVIMAYLPLH